MQQCDFKYEQRSLYQPKNGTKVEHCKKLRPSRVPLKLDRDNSTNTKIEPKQSTLPGQNSRPSRVLLKMNSTSSKINMQQCDFKYEQRSLYQPKNGTKVEHSTMSKINMQQSDFKYERRSLYQPKNVFEVTHHDEFIQEWVHKTPKKMHLTKKSVSTFWRYLWKF